MKKNLLLFVEHLPSANRNTFFETELSFLSEKFEKITVIPLYYSETNLKTSPKIEILNVDYFTPVNRLKILFTHFFLILKIYGTELFFSKHRFKYLTEFKTNLNTLLIHIGHADTLKKKVAHLTNENTVYYTYWFKQHTFSLLILKALNKKLTILSRVHGCDYDEAQINTYLPFRYWQYRNMDLILPISQFAGTYLTRNFNVSPDKIRVSRLGLEKKSGLSPVDPGNLHIVSCSSIIPLKQITKIAQIILEINLPVTWTHFGDGPDKQKVLEVLSGKKQNHSINLKGHVSNKEFLSFLAHEPVSLFMNYSVSEGIPVSIMEAMGLGIPAMAPEICGIPEIIKMSTGYFIPENSEPKEIAQRIEKLHSTQELYSLDKRRLIKESCEENFSDEINYGRLTNELVN